MFFLFFTDAAIDSTFTKQKTDKPIETKKEIKEANTDNTIILDETKSKKEKAKSRKRKNARDTQDATTLWNVEEIQCNGEIEGEIIEKPQHIDNMFDIMEENIRRKVELKLQRVKEKLTESKVNEDKREKEEDEDYSPDLEFKRSKRKPILDLPLEETTSKVNLQQDVSPTSLPTTASLMKESADKPIDKEAEIDPQKYLNVKPKYLRTQLPNSEAGCDEALDNSEEEDEARRRIMSEAFADDDVVEEFRKEKEEEVNDFRKVYKKVTNK